jgi:hypothetical protein
MPKPKKRANGRHPDAKHLTALEAKFEGKPIKLAEALGVTSQRLHNWKIRGIAPAERGKVFKLMEKHGCAPPLKWLTG